MIKKTFCFALNTLLLIFLTSNTASARAQNNFDRTSSAYKDISADIESVNLGLNIPYLRDANKNLTIEDILNQDETSWLKRNEEIPNLGVDPANFWFKHTLKFTSAESKDYLLEVGYSALDYIDVYFIQNNRVHYSYNAGDHLPFSSRPIDHRNFLFPLPKFNANQNVDIVIRVQTAGAVQFASSPLAADGILGARPITANAANSLCSHLANNCTIQPNAICLDAGPSVLTLCLLYILSRLHSAMLARA